MSVATGSAFERVYFDAGSVGVHRNGVNIPALLGMSLSDEDIAYLSGAPTGARVTCALKSTWAPSEVGADRPDPGLYFYVQHPQIVGANCIGLCLVATPGGTPFFRMYVKDVHILPSAPAGLAGTMVARIARRCLVLGIREMRLLAAGGRLWPDMVPGQRWGGFVAWAKYGFDMPLIQQDATLLQHFPHFPPHLMSPKPCVTVQEVLQSGDGLAWWKLCGTGHFMTFDCSHPRTASIAVLDSTLAAKGI